MAPQPTDRICDPAGFLVESYDYVLRKYSSAAGTHTEIVDGETVTLYSGVPRTRHSWKWERIIESNQRRLRV